MTDVTVVCAGVKSILDIGATLEYLETAGVPVITYGADEFPAFFSRKSGFPAECRLDSTREIAALINAKDEMGLKGGVLWAGGQVVAFTLGEELNQDMFVVHIEKALADIQGAYPMINQQFLIHEASQYSYVNREEDTGAEGLRKAKLSYYPAFLQEKGVVRRNEQ